MSRTRSEYRLAPIVVDGDGFALETKLLENEDREPLATLMLAAYRDTIDDEGEVLDDAREAIDHYLAHAIRSHSFVAVEQGAPVAFSFVVVVDDLHYIDPVVVSPTHQGQGLGRAAVRCSLRSLAASGVTEVGATITDGNVPSERLFARLGFVRVGAWG
ncbi:MAG: GNAT family N-acetyltransferase [Actinomycetota bacterium]